jgi:aspartyl protease
LKNLLWRTNAPAGKIAALAGALFMAVLAALGQARAASEEPQQAPAVQIYASADDNTLPIGTLAAGENATPIAETLGAGSVKWYLVKSKSGVVGWIKQGDGTQSKKAHDFFRALPAETHGIALDIPTASAAAAPGNAVLIPVTLIGGSVIVSVTFNRSVSANLLLDTGASMTMISRRLASNLALATTASGRFSGIGGTVRTQIGRVNSIKVGDAEVSGMAVSIHDIPQVPRFEGLLGMDFLGRFQISVDPVKKLLVLTPR